MQNAGDKAVSRIFFIAEQNISQFVLHGKKFPLLCGKIFSIRFARKKISVIARQNILTSRCAKKIFRYSNLILRSLKLRRKAA